MKKRWSILSAVLCVALLTGGCGTGSKNDAGTGKEQTFSHETREENEHQSNLDVLQPSAYGNVQGLNLEKGSSISIIGRGSSSAYWKACLLYTSMAAGMGSRYGGLKQIDPVDKEGHIIMDFSLFDAKRAGFEKVIFIIKKENEDSFREAVGNRMAKYMEVSYVFQDINNIPEGFEVPEGRVKPWGTGHAVLSCIDEIDGPFAVINADDYYGRHAFEAIYNYLSEHEDDDKYRYAMVGYLLKNTVTDNGHVARGICTTNEEGELVNITERTRIEKRDGKIAFTENDGETWENLPEDTLVSMNMWGFTRSILDELKAEFPQFLKKGLTENPMKCEYFLPAVVSNLLEADRATAAVLPSEDKWYGVTYKEDKPVVVEAIRNLKKEGLYPENLWEE